jgi:hypothetical protein
MITGVTQAVPGFIQICEYRIIRATQQARLAETPDLITTHQRLFYCPRRVPLSIKAFQPTLALLAPSLQPYFCMSPVT